MTINSEKTQEGYLNEALKAGLSGKASAVYIALLRAGTPLAPKNLVKQASLHRQYVYDGLKELQSYGLISAIGQKKSVKYVAANPDRLLKSTEKKHLDELDGVHSLIRLYDRSPAGVVDVIRGAAATIESEFQLLRDAAQDSFLDVIGGAGMNWVRLFEGRIGEWETCRRKKDIKLRYIGDEESVRHNRKESMIVNESRVLLGIGHIVNVAIRPESVTFNIFEPEVVTIRVRNKEAVASQRALFEILWNVAKQSR